MQATPANFFGILVKRGDRSFLYEISDQWTQGETGFTGDLEYYGYLTTTGAWILQQHTISTGQWRYVTGQTGYSAFLPFASNLTALGALAWVRYDALFV
jgi:hypothetical protein